jgi:hypothetical protein
MNICSLYLNFLLQSAFLTPASFIYKIHKCNGPENVLIRFVIKPYTPCFFLFLIHYLFQVLY